MKVKELITELGNRFGQTNVVVRSEYHTQILTSGKPHDIWFSTKEGLKWRLAGMQGTQSGSPERLLQQLDKWVDKDTDFGKMQAALSLCNLIGNVSLIAVREKITKAVFVDAGFRDGKARMGIVRIDGEDVTAVRRNITSDNIKDIHDAEEAAIRAGLLMADKLGPDTKVYSDSRTAIARVNLPRVVWLSRVFNKPADKMANLRTGN